MRKKGREADHIVPRSNGGRDRWFNLTGACSRCNRAKSTRSLFEFTAGVQHDVELHGSRRIRFGGLEVAAVDLDEAKGSSSPGRSWTRSVLQTLLRTHPETDGALAYRRRHRGNGQRPAWNHALATRPGTVDAGTVCRQVGGGGSHTHGGVESDRTLFTPIDKTRQ